MSNQYLKLKLFNKSVSTLLVGCTLGMVSNVYSAPVKSSLKVKHLKRESSIVEVFGVVPPKNAKKQNFEVLTHSDNRVFNVSYREVELIHTLQTAAAEKKPLQVELNGTEIVSAKYLDEKATADYDSENPKVDYAFAPEGSEYNQTYSPTVLNSDEEAQMLFNRARNMLKDSQCYMRAHLWSYQWSVISQIKSMKVFMFFTDKFKKDNKSKWGKPFKWWFHVAPFVYVRKADGTLKEVVLDREFLDGPVEMETWTNHFMVTSKTPNPDKCVDMPEYKQDLYFSNPWNSHCLLRKEPMYVMQPKDAETYDNHSDPVSSFKEIDTKLARKAICTGLEIFIGDCNLHKKLF